MVYCTGLLLNKTSHLKSRLVKNCRPYLWN